jgi:hypothetical protein
MIYFKSVLAGAATFTVTVIICSVLARLIMMRVPLLAQRVFPPQHFDVQFGSHYYINFPLWQIIVAGVLAFVIGSAWMLGRASSSADR